MFLALEPSWIKASESIRRLGLSRPKRKSELSLVIEVADIHQAKTHLSRLVERALAGEEVIIAKAGKPVVRLVPYQKNTAPQRKLGVWKGKVKIKAGFDKLPKSMMDAFLGKLP